MAFRWMPEWLKQAPSGGPDGPGDGLEPGETLFDEAFLGQLRRLTVMPGQVRAEGIAGEHRSRRRGVSPEFADFKRYSPGDDYRRIDWNIYARLDGLFIRLSEVTAELGVHVLLDASESMQWRGEAARPAKFTYARRVAGALGYVAIWHFDRLTVTPFAEGPGHAFGPAQGRAQALPMLRAIESMRPHGGTALGETLSRYLHAHRRPGVLIVISDFLTGEPEDLRGALREARGRGWHVALVQVLDDAEVSAEAAAAWLAKDEREHSQGHGHGHGHGATPLMELVDSESGEKVQLAAGGELARRYGERVAAWLAGIEAVCAEEQATYLRLLTGWDFEDVTMRLLREREVIA
ncbi:MAG: DUF58 domain-containing protein [Thermomicrobiales bacterium]